MKSLLLAAALTGVSLTGSAFAYTPKDSAAPVTAAAPRPIPDSVVKPTGLPHDFTRGVINIEFSLDESGRPKAIKVPSVNDPVLKRHLVEAFRQWRFEAGAVEAAASGKRFVLPLDIRAES